MDDAGAEAGCGKEGGAKVEAEGAGVSATEGCPPFGFSKGGHFETPVCLAPNTSRQDYFKDISTKPERLSGRGDANRPE